MTYDIDWIKKEFDKGEAIKFIFFWGHSGKKDEAVGKFIFSQWFPASFESEGVEYKTAEHWMMAKKALLFDDHEIFHAILKANKPAEVKELGRKIRNFDEHKWNAEKYALVKSGNALKFQQNERLKAFLCGTKGRIIAEASPVDSIWGIGLAKDFAGIENPHSWRGQNLLGFALMEVRDLIC